MPALYDDEDIGNLGGGNALQLELWRLGRLIHGGVLIWWRKDTQIGKYGKYFCIPACFGVGY
jgi:hypothetical protein